MRFQIASPIPLKSWILLDILGPICLLLIYLVMKLSESLIFLKSDARCSRDLWSKIGWKFLSYNSGSIGVFGSYSNYILMTSLLTHWDSMNFLAWEYKNCPRRILVRSHSMTSYIAIVVNITADKVINVHFHIGR